MTLQLGKRTRVTVYFYQVESSPISLSHEYKWCSPPQQALIWWCWCCSQ